MSAHRLEPLINPGSIAILGASADRSRIGGAPLALSRHFHFGGQLYPINPKYTEIDGLRCYPDIEALPGPVDLLVLAVGAQEVAPQLRRAAAKGIRAAIVFASGFAETHDAAGLRLQAELEACIAEIGIPVAGPNCMGFANLASHAYTTFGSVYWNIAPPDDHTVALVTQSGTVCSALYMAGRKDGVGYAATVNTGNEAALEFSEYVDYFASQARIDVIAGYVEGIRDGARFRNVAGRLKAEGRPLILLKIGDTEKGAEAAASHTAALSGSQAVFRAVCDDLNVMLPRDLAGVADLIRLARFRTKRAGPRVAVLTISGALGALLADEFVKLGCTLPTLPAAVQATLRTGIPDYGMVSNPVDLTGNVMNQAGFIGRALEALDDCDDIDMIVVYSAGYLLEKMTAALVEAAGRARKLITVVDLLGAPTHATLDAAAVPVFEDTTRAASALAVFARWSERTRLPAAADAAMPAPSTSFVVAAALAQGRSALDEMEGTALVAGHGFPVGQAMRAATAEDAAQAARRLGWPVVMKILSADVPHKSDCGGVRLNLRTEDDVRRAFAEIVAAVGRAHPAAAIAGVLVQHQEPPGLEVLLGITRDPVFGPVMTVGLGGIFTEVMRDIAHGTLPVTPGKAEAMLRRLKAYPLLTGLRGGAPRDVAALCGAMVALSDTMLAHGDRIEEIEVNPVLVRESGHGAIALDCLVRIRADAPPQG